MSRLNRGLAEKIIFWIIESIWNQNDWKSYQSNGQNFKALDSISNKERQSGIILCQYDKYLANNIIVFVYFNPLYKYDIIIIYKLKGIQIDWLKWIKLNKIFIGNANLLKRD